ncbi:MAG: (d)CMP kinase [Phycisphaerales bacterium]|nr:(d)CMP kinase [Phycisphaerales bacterium]
MVVTIDGPAGSGKSTAARKLAARLEIPYLDTGAMYRAIAHECLRRDIELSDEQAVRALSKSIRMDLDCGPTHTRIRLDGHDVSEAIRTLAVSAATSRVARMQSVRTLLVEQQRRIGEKLGSFVTEGRDQGSVVFPSADAKFVLDAALARRTERRFQEMTADGEDVTLDSVRANLVARDAVDSRQWEPLLKSGAAIVIDTTNLTIAEVVERMAGDISALGFSVPPAS